MDCIICVPLFPPLSRLWILFHSTLHRCLFYLLMSSPLQLPNGVNQSQAAYQDRFGKLQEHLRQLALLFRKLRLLYERCVEMTSDLQEDPTEVKGHERLCG